MKRITPPTRDEVLANWSKQYPAEEGNRPFARGTTSKGIKQALEALPEDADPEQIAQVIGNTSWTHRFCAVCDYASTEGVFFETFHKFICASCTEKAVRAV